MRIGEHQPAFARKGSEAVRAEGIAPGRGGLCPAGQGDAVVAAVPREAAVTVVKQRRLRFGQGGFPFGAGAAGVERPRAYAHLQRAQLLLQRAAVRGKHHARRGAQKTQLVGREVVKKVYAALLADQLMAVTGLGQGAEPLAQRMPIARWLGDGQHQIHPQAMHAIPGMRLEQKLHQRQVLTLTAFQQQNGQIAADAHAPQGAEGQGVFRRIAQLGRLAGIA